MLRGTPIRRMRGVLGVVLAMIVLMGLASPSSASAAAKPVVTHVSPARGSTVGGTTVTVRGKHFAARGKSAVKKVLFGKKAATHVRVLSARMIKATAPTGTGVVDVTVTTAKGRSAKVPADRYTYREPAASKLVITTQPVGGLSGALLATEPVVKVEDSAALRAVNTKDYLVKEKGIDASRITVATSPTDDQNVEDYLVPVGANFTVDVPKTAPVNETVVKPVTRKPLGKPVAHKKTAKSAK